MVLCRTGGSPFCRLALSLGTVTERPRSYGVLTQSRRAEVSPGLLDGRRQAAQAKDLANRVKVSAASRARSCGGQLPPRVALDRACLDVTAADRLGEFDPLEQPLTAGDGLEAAHRPQPVLDGTCERSTAFVVSPRARCRPGRVCTARRALATDGAQ